MIDLASALIRLANELRTQDSACTQNPIFIVQQKRLIDGLDPEIGVETRWLVPGGEGLYTTDEALDALEIEAPVGLQYDALIQSGAEETGVAVVWEYVAAHFTRSAAERYIEENAHRMVDPRVYVDSQYRCHEWNLVIGFLQRIDEDPGTLESILRAAREGSAS